MINQDFFLALDELEKQKGIAKDEFISALENALGIAYKKNSADGGAVEVKINPDKKSIKIYAIRTIVEEVVDSEKEISLADAQLIKKSYKLGDKISNEIATKNFGRIAAQTAKQVLLQKLREIEHENTVNEFEDKEGELMACTIRRIEDGNVYVEIGGGQIEGVMLPQDQVPTEKYHVGDKIMQNKKHTC